jgi:hypothetical protein
MFKLSNKHRRYVMVLFSRRRESRCRIGNTLLRQIVLCAATGLILRSLLTPSFHSGQANALALLRKLAERVDTFSQYPAKINCMMCNARLILRSLLAPSFHSGQANAHAALRKVAQRVDTFSQYPAKTNCLYGNAWADPSLTTRPFVSLGQANALAVLRKLPQRQQQVTWHSPYSICFGTMSRPSLTTKHQSLLLPGSRTKK